MIPKGQGYHYLPLKNLFTLLRRITSKYDDDFYCLNPLYLFRTGNKLESHKKICRNTFVML